MIFRLLIFSLRNCLVLRMKANNKFIYQDLSFWADVRCISQEVGYTERQGGGIKIPTAYEIETVYKSKGLSSEHISVRGDPTKYGEVLTDYFEYRADVLNTIVKNNLMTGDEARALFEEIKQSISPEILKKIPMPLNKQKGEKKNYAFLTCVVNMLVASSLQKYFEKCDYDPRQLTLLTKDKRPLRTLSRRVDGAFPSSMDPMAIWEIKEYYYTTTFGSRVADGVYETLVDGSELAELLKSTQRKVLHFLIIDAYGTWWEMGRSYLCRMIDMLNMGMVDEIIFGREVVERIPQVFGELLTQYVNNNRSVTTSPSKDFPSI